MSFELPLFPLDTVLFPGAPLALHIFEDRYKEMVAQCLGTGGPFGVVLIRSGREVGAPVARPHSVGCMARIVDHERLSGGRLNIVVVGEERFRIKSLEESRAYLVGKVEAFPMLREGEDDPAPAERRLRPVVAQYLAELGRLGEVDISPDQMPDDPLAFGYLAAYLLPIPAEDKQSLLVRPGARQLLLGVKTLYRREIALLEAMKAKRNEQPQGTFSLN